MDRFLTDKWWGRLDIRNTLVEFSTSYHVYEDKFENYVKPEKINHLWKQIFQAQKINYVHLVQIQSWKRSMYLRYGIEVFISLVFTLIF
jgi:hypothetical protein